MKLIPFALDYAFICIRLKQMKQDEFERIRPPQPNPTSQWYSICSAHVQYCEDCNCCNAGHWIDEADPYVQIRHWLWKKSPKLWREWANRPGSNDGKHLERIFPKLKPYISEHDWLRLGQEYGYLPKPEPLRFNNVWRTLWNRFFGKE
jgi:hypothetical protein